MLSKTILITCLLTKYLLKSYLHQIRHRRDFSSCYDCSSLGTQKFVYTLAFWQIFFYTLLSFLIAEHMLLLKWTLTWFDTCQLAIFSFFEQCTKSVFVNFCPVLVNSKHGCIVIKTWFFFQNSLFLIRKLNVKEIYNKIRPNSPKLTLCSDLYCYLCLGVKVFVLAKKLQFFLKYLLHPF